MVSCPNYGLLAATYLGSEDLGDVLADLARFVRKYHADAGDLGSRAARRADLDAAANAAGRFRKALEKIDGRTLVAALEVELGRAGSEVHTAAAPQGNVNTDSGTLGSAPQADILQHRFPELLGALDRTVKTVASLEAGLRKLAKRTAVAPKGGHPGRHDALQAGLEALAHRWREAGKPEPTTSVKRGSFSALAVNLFGKPHGPFDVTTVEGAVVKFVRELNGDTDAS